jgi:amino acid transporter
MKKKSYPLIATITYLVAYAVLTGLAIVPVSLFLSYSLLPFISLVICLSLPMVFDLIYYKLEAKYDLNAISQALKLLLSLVAISSVVITVIVEIGIMNLAELAAIITLPAIIVVGSVLLVAIGAEFVICRDYYCNIAHSNVWSSLCNVFSGDLKREADVRSSTDREIMLEYNSEPARRLDVKGFFGFDG